MAVQKTYSSEKEIAEIWKLFRETDRKMQKTDRKIEETSEQMKETDRKVQETSKQMKETDRYIKSMSAETDKMMRKTDQRMRKTDRRIKELNELFTGQWGKLMESLVEGDLIKLLKERQIPVEATLTNLAGRYNGEETEFDIIAVNGAEIVVVEVKTTLNLRDVKRFVGKLENFKKWRPEYRDKKVYGAVAYLKARGDSKGYAEEQRLFVIRAVGGSASIVNSKDFKPRSFS